jgi:hypothetical protein
MLERVTTLLLVVTSAIFGLVASIALFVPDVLFGPVGIAAGEAAGMAELRAAYFGLFGACSVTFGMGATRPAWRDHALWLAAMVLGGFTGARFYSLLVDGVPSGLAFGAHSAETVGFIVSVWVLYLRRAT